MFISLEVKLSLRTFFNERSVQDFICFTEDEEYGFGSGQYSVCWWLLGYNIQCQLQHHQGSHEGTSHTVECIFTECPQDYTVQGGLRILWVLCALCVLDLPTNADFVTHCW